MFFFRSFSVFVSSFPFGRQIPFTLNTRDRICSPQPLFGKSSSFIAMRAFVQAAKIQSARLAMFGVHQLLH
jgi:hypothetical protein